jgi:hypothetical protein
MRYCETADELKKNPEAKYWIRKVCNGNQDAFDMLWGWWNFFHMFDDLVDQDKTASKEIILKEFAFFITNLSFNKFYEDNKVSLCTLLLQLINRWLDGDEWEKSEDKWKRGVSDVLRCGDMEVYFHVAYLTGGWDYMRSLKELRTYDKNTGES